MEADYKLTAAAFSYSCTYVQTRILLMVNISAIHNYYSNGFNWSWIVGGKSLELCGTVGTGTMFVAFFCLSVLALLLL